MHQQEIELLTCACTFFQFCHLFTDHWRGRTSFLSSEINIFFLFLIFYFYSLFIYFFFFSFFLFFYFLFIFISFYFISFYFLVVFLVYNLKYSLVVFRLYNDLRHTHKQEMELPTCVCTSFHFCQLFTDHWRGRTSFLSSEIIILI